MNSPPEPSSITGTSSSRCSPELTGKPANEKDDTLKTRNGAGSSVSGSLSLVEELDALCLNELDQTEQGIDDFLNNTQDLGRCELRYGTVHVLEMPDCEHIVIAHFLLCLFLRVKFQRQDNEWKGLHGFIEANIGEKRLNSSLQADFSIGRIRSGTDDLKNKITFTSSNLPNVVVEVTSSNYANDTETKRKIYAEIGVPLYVIVHPTERELWVFTLEGDGDGYAYKNPQKYNENETYKSLYFGEVVVKNLLDPNPDQHLNLPAEMREERDQVMKKLAAALDEAKSQRKEKERMQREAKREREEKECVQREATRLREENRWSQAEAKKEREQKEIAQGDLQRAMARIAESEEQVRNSSSQQM